MTKFQYAPLFLLISFSLINTVEARLFLDISLMNKKGINIGLTLGSEIHSTEEVIEEQPIRLRMKSGLTLDLQAKFENTLPQDVYGPSSNVIIQGKVTSSDHVVLKDFTKNPLIVSLEEKKKIVYTQKSQLIELIVRPNLK